jgi:hypothetical protein
MVERFEAGHTCPTLLAVDPGIFPDASAAISTMNMGVAKSRRGVTLGQGPQGQAAGVFR